jgi:hypothetical protein
MTMSQAGKSLTAPLDAALPFTTPAALSLAIGSFAPHPDPSRKVSPRAIVRSRRLITDCGSQLNCSVRHDELHQTLASILVDISDPRTTRQQEVRSDRFKRHLRQRPSPSRHPTAHQ